MIKVDSTSMSNIQNQTTQTLLSAIICLGIYTMTIAIPQTGHAETTTIIQPNANEQTDANNELENSETDSDTINEDSVEIQATKQFEDTVAASYVPDESDLSEANRDLLMKNAILEREVDDLKTQVNVLVNERGGQIFMYGVYTALGSFLSGGILSWLIFRKRNNW